MENMIEIGKLHAMVDRLSETGPIVNSAGNNRQGDL